MVSVINVFKGKDIINIQLLNNVFVNMISPTDQRRSVKDSQLLSCSIQIDASSNMILFYFHYS